MRITLRYRYTIPSGDRMIFVCEAVVGKGITLSHIKDTVQGKLVNEHGSISDLSLIAQNNPIDKAMLLISDNP